MQSFWNLVGCRWRGVRLMVIGAVGRIKTPVYFLIVGGWNLLPKN